MTGRELFDLYRHMLVIVGLSYTVVRTMHAIWNWQSASAAAPRMEALARRYLVMHLLRIRVRRFVFELVQIAGLIVVLVYVIQLHWR